MKTGKLVSGIVQRVIDNSLVVTLDDGVEAILTEAQSVASEYYAIGDRLSAIVVEVEGAWPNLRVRLSRIHRHFVRRLLEREVPEIANGTITVRGLERMPGVRTKVGVDTTDPNVDCVSACDGVDAVRIQAIRDELRGERIDIFQWRDNAAALIREALKPAEVESIELRVDDRKALVRVTADQLSAAVGRKGNNVRLAARLTGWDIDLLRPDEPDGPGATDAGR